MLIRALEPVDGIDEMTAHRSKKRSSPLKRKHLCSGPSKLCQALAITKANSNEVDLTASAELWLEDGPDLEDELIKVSKRIGIQGAGPESVNKMYRLYERNNAYVSVIDKE